MLFKQRWRSRGEEGGTNGIRFDRAGALHTGEGGWGEVCITGLE